MPDPDASVRRKENGLEIEVGSGVPTDFRRLITISEHWAAVINDVAQSFLGIDGAVRWIVEAESGSVRLLLRPEATSDRVQPSRVAQLPEVVSEGVAHLEHEASRPPYFGDRALEQLHELSGSVKDDFPVKVRNGHERTTVTTQLAANVEQILGKPRFSIGSVEGRMEAVNIHAGADNFFVWPSHGSRTRCLFGRHVTLDEVLPAIGRRVSVRGRIRTRPSGVLDWIEVHSLRVLGEESVSAGEVRGIFEGRGTAEY